MPTDSHFDPDAHLCYSAAVNNSSIPRVIRITIRQSKTDPFRKGVNLFLGRTSVDLCPVEFLLNYLVVKGSKDGPLIIFKDGRPLTRQWLVNALREVLQAARVNQSKYSGHSFRIGAASSHYSSCYRGMEDLTLRRWNSVAYLYYVRMSRFLESNWPHIPRPYAVAVLDSVYRVGL